MKPYDIYLSFEQKVNKNSTNTNIKVPLGVFVTLWNDQKRQWLDDKVKGKENSNYIEDLEDLLEVDTKLQLYKSYSDKDTFNLPENFFRRVTSYSIAEKDDCSNKRLTNWLIKPKDINTLLSNSNFNPNFDWEETLGILNKGKITVYKKDFKLKEVFLTYYREPKDIDIEGYLHLDGTPSENIEVDLDKFSIQEITNRTALDAVSNYESIEQMQIAAQRIQQNESII